MSRLSLFVILTLAHGCVETGTVVCADGRSCPEGTVCHALTDPDATICARPEELAACNGLEPLATCEIDGVTEARCYDGACLAAGCGNLRLDPGEPCDDGNHSAGDGCAADCRSTEICGNSVVDPVNGESCDDGNALDHDGCASTCKRERLTWIERSAHTFHRRQGIAAYDPIRDRVVMFGGSGSVDQLRSDTWEWDGAAWRKHTGVEPSARAQPAMAFDGSRLVMFGGYSGDTWLYDGVQWTPYTGPGPGPRYGHAMAYDSRRKRVVMAGGGIVASSDPGGTWEWDGATWHEVLAANEPTDAFWGTMAYDPLRGVVVLSAVGSNGPARTWTYDGVAWTNVTHVNDAAVLPAAAYSLAMAFDTKSQRMIAFGGDSTYTWDGTSWSKLTTTTVPPPRRQLQLASNGAGLLMYGGWEVDSLSDTWIWNGSDWSLPTAGPTGTTYAFLANDLAREEIVMVTDNSGTWVHSKTGWTLHTAGPSPGPRTLAAVAYDPRVERVTVFGGAGLADTWQWTGTAWTQLQPASSPPPHFNSAFGFDGRDLILFGGITESGPGPTGALADTWRFDGATWTQVTTAHSPTPRLRAAAAYDPIRDHLVLVGGFQPGGASADETWTFDGTDWTLRTVSRHPESVVGRPLVWNAARQRLTVYADGIWEWDGTDWSIYQTTEPGPGKEFVGTSFDGKGVFVLPQNGIANLWQLQWQGPTRDEQCTGTDLDGDTLDRCADPDCWRVCAPACPPGTTCATTTCGDGTCNAQVETCRTCPSDCACVPTCGDLACDPGEVCAGDCP